MEQYMKNIRIQYEGQEILVPTMKIKGKLWFHFRGETYSYTHEDLSSSGSGGASSGDPLKVLAPMPGKIIKVLVSEGDKVSIGQTLVAMEAMKMEYNLKAQQDLKVKKINCKEQQTTGLGDVLIELEESDG